MNEITENKEVPELRTGVTIKILDDNGEEGGEDSPSNINKLVEKRIEFQKFLATTNCDSAYNFIESGYNPCTKMGVLEISSRGIVLFLEIYAKLIKNTTIEKVQMYFRKDMENADSMIHGFEIQYKGE